MLTIVAILLDHECGRRHKKLPVLLLFPISTQRLQENMPYLVQPPAQSIDAYNPLLTYTLADPLPAEISILKDLQKWGWQISVHFEDEEIYIDAARETEKAIKKMRRRTQMIYGDVVGDSPRLTLEEMWQREATKKEEERQYDTKEKEEVNDAASMMSRMTEQRAWVRWADEEAGLEPESPNVSESLICEYQKETKICN